MRIGLWVCASLVAMSLAPTATFAQDIPGIRHGFMLRAAGGLGIGDPDGQGFRDGELDSRGVSYSLHLALGEMLGESLAVHGNFTTFNVLTVAREIELEGSEVFENLGDELVFRYIGLGPGLTYYIEPEGYYVSASVSYARLFVETEDNPSGEASVGVGYEILVGHEWAVGPSWTLGLATQVLYSISADNKVAWTVLQGALLFSATFTGRQ